jgi:hypothetical protein
MLTEEQRDRLRPIGKLVGEDLLTMVEQGGEDASKVLEALGVAFKANHAAAMKLLPSGCSLSYEQAQAIADVAKATGQMDLLRQVCDAQQEQPDAGPTAHKPGAKGLGDVLAGWRNRVDHGVASNTIGTSFKNALAARDSKARREAEAVKASARDAVAGMGARRPTTVAARMEASRSQADAFRGGADLLAATGKAIKAARPPQDRTEAVAQAVLRLPEVRRVQEIIDRMVGTEDEPGALARHLADIEQRLDAVDGGGQGQKIIMGPGGKFRPIGGWPPFMEQWVFAVGDPSILGARARATATARTSRAIPGADYSTTWGCHNESHGQQSTTYSAAGPAAH